MLYELKRIREDSGISQSKAADIFGVSLFTYRNWEQCKNMPRDSRTLKAIADWFGVSIEALCGYDMVEPGAFSSLPEQGDAKFVYVPLVSDIAAGTPVEPDDVEDHIPIPQEVMRRHPNAFLLKIDGTSMDRVLPNGCYALVDPKMTDVVNGRIYAVKVNGDLATVKRVRMLEHGVVLEPDSASDPSHEPIVFKESNERYRELVVKGRVVWYTLPLGRDLEE